MSKKSNLYGKSGKQERGTFIRHMPTIKPYSAPVVPTRSTKRKHPFYGSTSWIKTRATYIRSNPLCERCKKRDRIRPARLVHHKRPLRYGGEQLHEDNLMSLCSERCHAAEHKKIEHRRKAGDVNW